MDEPSEELSPPQLRRIPILDWRGRRPYRLERRLLIQGAARAMAVVVADELTKNGLDLAPMDDQQAVEARRTSRLASATSW